MRVSKDTSRLLIILRQDAARLADRIITREKEYLHILSMKRTREHFNAVFRSNFKTITVQQLMLLSEELIINLEDFYNTIDDMHWYLVHTEDMPATIEDRVHAMVRDVKNKYDQLNLYLNAELETHEESDVA
ncbi:hypothetical protein BALOs_0309 [Halobacteriovorax sp. BALOs_7]|uniref:Uncharacterized protein n=2 Tax=Halobacteriovorax TaxID=1652133 RepID=A0ABY0ILE3_9BACT|nr:MULTISPECIES: hypothetical protein [Halobacteriovorax]AYF43324.1 hypothetical protein BALOs_0309 [Halobacteriovorax sp. BALOs_7]RZF22102.1 hypothetical protein DAY19_10495 [Halobacteriovorax vibrionivorans]TGD46937.1 hypothetical protein EP118_09910 [Halobacteriovorax sp. Y22]